MFGIEWTEYAVIAIVALIVIGPKELPAVLRAIGQWTTKIRRMAAEFQSQFQEALREAEMADLKKEVDDLNDAARGFTFDDPLHLKEGTKWEPKPDDVKPDDIKADGAAKPAEGPSTEAPQETASVASASSPSQAVEGQSIQRPVHATAGTEGDEAFPVAADHPAIEQTATVPSPAGTAVNSAANGGRAPEAVAAPAVAPSHAAPPLSEASGERGSEGGVLS